MSATARETLLVQSLRQALEHAQEHQTGCLWCGEDEDYVEENGETSPEHQAVCWYYVAERLIAQPGGEEGK